MRNDRSASNICIHKHYVQRSQSVVTSDEDWAQRPTVTAPKVNSLRFLSNLETLFIKCYSDDEHDRRSMSASPKLRRMDNVQLPALKVAITCPDQGRLKDNSLITKY
jgi:hypothetical protein